MATAPSDSAPADAGDGIMPAVTVGAPLPEPAPAADPGPDRGMGGVGVLPTGLALYGVAAPVEEPTAEVALRVVHGDLCFCTQPVFVGHYEDDEIRFAELELDRKVGGRLTEAQKLGVYPGAIGTTALFWPQARSRRGIGAVVVGLGRPGELTPGGLTQSYQRGVLQLVLAHADRLRSRDEAAADASPAHGSPGAAAPDARPADDDLAAASLMVGSGQGGVSLDDCAYAMLRAIDEANVLAVAAGGPARKDDGSRRRPATIRPLTRVSFIELQRDTAHLALRALRRVLEQGRFRCRFDLAPEIEERPGGRERLFMEPPGGWWRRVQIDEAADGSLHFRMLTDRARVEQMPVPTQTALVDAIVARAVGSSQDPGTTGRTLFELLMPNDLKAFAPDRQDLVLIVDEKTARFPWELMVSGASSDGKPIAVGAGMIRQLQASIFRRSPTLVADPTAFVLGDTVCNLPALPGAQAEAKAVAARLQDPALEDGRFKVELVVRGQPVDTVNRLFSRPFRVLHLAAHGFYEAARPADAATGAPAAKARAGLVLGPDTFLTPAEIEQMGTVPELVFINCCHLGRIDGVPAAAPGSGAAGAFNLLAANVATQFIRMGVRAVVAAGWAVHDGAARDFADRFYEEMLAGRTFGAAVKAARALIYEKCHPASNTWGAYQCYGDPFYRLTREPADADTGNDLQVTSQREVTVEAENIATATRGASPEKLDKLARRAAELVEAARDKWDACRPSESAMWAALGLMMGRLGQFDEAVRLCERAFAETEARFTVATLEQYHNFRIRAAGARAVDAATSAEDRASAIGQLQASVRSLEQLIAPEGIWPLLDGGAPAVGRATRERLALIGGGYRRLARVHRDPRQRHEALERMRLAYWRQHLLRCGLPVDDQAFERGLTTPGALADAQVDAYAITQWWAAEVALAARDDKARAERSTHPQGTEWLDRVRALQVAEPDFWSDVAAADARLAQALLAHVTVAPMIPPDLTGIGDAYLQARGGRPNDRDSVRDQIRWYRQMLAEADTGWPTATDALDRLLGQLAA